MSDDEAKVISPGQCQIHITVLHYTTKKGDGYMHPVLPHSPSTYLPVTVNSFALAKQVEEQSFI